jgi:hypothetical protein
LPKAWFLQEENKIVSTNHAGIYLIVDFDWPKPLSADQPKKARRLHDLVQNQSWIKEVVAASGGIGHAPVSTWIFWLENYAALDRLLRDEEDEVSQAYIAFFAEMPHVTKKVREEVVFL